MTTWKFLDSDIAGRIQANSSLEEFKPTAVEKYEFEYRQINNCTIWHFRPGLKIMLLVQDFRTFNLKTLMRTESCHLIP